MAAQRILEMDFSTELGKTQRLRIYDAKETLTGAEVAAAMDKIITTGIFKSTGGNLTGKVDARIITTTADDLDLV
ncbi:Protein of unknown function DUF2922 [Syntrophomonas zehnderi OL-4]|uniref:DUF2922 domain-containing protein n=1 Tax=Syntrophomonas zehnderi OL-4 TaxID=690567 RepID=A0A0E4C8Z7_9FIRM|nr:DUF2922 domain-containing protein [Syntrophomonas zehnderi]CFX78422.1 Protein of unknown function DUF2922 [Syntrophomonas zehnderi OL-4]